MRIRVFIILTILLAALWLWAVTSGGLLIFGLTLLAVFCVISVGYSDTAILFFLGAREIRNNSEQGFFEAASQEAYKLEVQAPNLYFYNGSLERGFVLQNRNTVSIVLSKKLLEACGPEELRAICFELLVQVKKGMASKRTKVMFLLGFISWTTHSAFQLLSGIIRSKEIKKAIDWIVIYLLHPWLDFLFKFMLGESYFTKLAEFLKDYPQESGLLQRVRMKLRRPDFLASLPSKKLVEFGSIYKNSHYQNILALEFLPHEWNYLLNQEDEIRAKKA